MKDKVFEENDQIPESERRVDCTLCSSANPVTIKVEGAQVLIQPLRQWRGRIHEVHQIPANFQNSISKYQHYPPLSWSGFRVSLMFLCFCPCHVPHFVVMSRLSPATGISSRLHCSVDWSSDGRLLPFGFGFRRNDVPFKRRLRFVIRAQLSEAFSPDLGLDSQVNLLFSTSFFMRVDRFLLTSFA